MPRRGTALLLLILIACLGTMYSRRILFVKKGPPAFFVERHPGVAVLLGAGCSRPGIHQFPDAPRPLDVMKMTLRYLAPQIRDAATLYCPLHSGEALEFVLSGKKVVGIKRFWIPAGQRMALGIPLHPDRMSREDWQALPGIGPKLAQRIEEDRQQNGDFGSLEHVQRVSGIGPKRILRWKKFFQPP